MSGSKAHYKVTPITE